MYLSGAESIDFAPFLVGMRILLCVDVGAVEFDYGLEVGVVGGDRIAEGFADFLAANLAARDERDVENHVRVSRARN